MSLDPKVYAPVGVWDIEEKIEVFAPRATDDAQRDRALQAMPAPHFDCYCRAIDTMLLIETLAHGR